MKTPSLKLEMQNNKSSANAPHVLAWDSNGLKESFDKSSDLSSVSNFLEQFLFLLNN